MSLVFFDLETGGLTETHPNIQLAAVAVDDEFNELDCLQHLIEFREEDADRAALDMNHYDPARWSREAKPQLQVVRAFGKFLKKHASVQMISKRTGNPYNVARLAGHNVLTFDGPRIRRAFEQHGEFFAAHPIMLDTLQLCGWSALIRQEKPENLKLTTMAKFLGIETEGAHDALVDVRLNVQVAKALLAKKEIAA